MGGARFGRGGGSSFLAMASAAALLCLLPASARSQAKLYIFYPALVRPLALQEALAKRCPTVAITAFGRLTDFQAKVVADAPDAVLSLPAVLGQLDAYLPLLQGLRKGSATEPYVLLSLDDPVDPAMLAGATLGVVGLLERKPMAEFVQGLVKASPRLDRVTKVEDLLPLLTFRSVNAVLVPEAIAAEFKQKSRANLVAAKIEGAKVGLVSLAVRKARKAEPELVRAVRTLPAAELELLGVDAWK